jgi:hypothetical protein
MKTFAAIALLVPAIASADTRPEELFLGEAAWLQEASELQVTAMPSWRRDRWELGAGVEYGITPRVQLALEGSWIDGAQMDALREGGLGALFAPFVGERAMLAVGASGSAEITGMKTEWSVEPVVSAAVFSRYIGANLAMSAEIGDDVEPAFALGVFARTSRVAPLLEAAYAGEEISGRGGLAFQIGDFQIAAAVGLGSERGVSAHAALTWAVELADDDDKAP